jgi:uncharacterized protein YbjQ (UPF0145 family)
MTDQFEPAEVGELLKTVELGLDVTQFLRSPVGQYLMQKADDERADALADLVDASPADAETIRALQSTIKRADSIQYWLRDAVQAGINAEAQLDPRGE